MQSILQVERYVTPGFPHGGVMGKQASLRGGEFQVKFPVEGRGCVGLARGGEKEGVYARF